MKIPPKSSKSQADDLVNKEAIKAYALAAAAQKCGRKGIQVTHNVGWQLSTGSCRIDWSGASDVERAEERMVQALSKTVELVGNIGRESQHFVVWARTANPHVAELKELLLKHEERIRQLEATLGLDDAQPSYSHAADEWVAKNQDLLSRHPNSFLAVNLTTGKLVMATADLAVWNDFIGSQSPSQLSGLYVTHSSSHGF